MRTNTLDNFLTLYKKLMPKCVVLVKNKERYEEVKHATQTLADLILKEDSNAQIDISPDELTGTSISFSAKSNLIVFDKLQDLCNVLKIADTFEICPLTNGQVYIGLTFEKVFRPAPPIVNGKFQTAKSYK